MYLGCHVYTISSCFYAIYLVICMGIRYLVQSFSPSFFMHLCNVNVRVHVLLPRSVCEFTFVFAYIILVLYLVLWYLRM